jgi:hypothetical protein
MTYLDFERLESLDGRAFRAAVPYPWMNPEGLLTEDGYRRLLATLPGPSVFEERFGIQRAHGQRSHDRLALEYASDLGVADDWHAFVAELRSARYRRFLRRMLGRGGFRLKFHWHYTPRGCSVSPHCDAKHKIGSHIFSFNTAADWDPAWGGQTLILDDGGRFDRKSAPRFEDFDRVIAAENMGNRSLLFARRGNSWHGVRELTCPEGALRKVFIVVVDDLVLGLRREVLDRLRGKASDY